MKLDGYHMLCEILEIADLKENSTALFSAWVKRHIWRLPWKFPMCQAAAAWLCGIRAAFRAYSYTVLYVLARFAGNVFRNFNPDWSFIPGIASGGPDLSFQNPHAW